MSRSGARAVAWARDAARRFGRLEGGKEGQPGAVWVIPMPQAELAEAYGWPRSSGMVSWYLSTLCPAVRHRRRGIAIDDAELAALEANLASATRELSPVTARLARDLAFRLGRPEPQGTVLVSPTDPDRPATTAEMAAAVDMSVATLGRHLRRLAEAGRAVRHGRTWVLPLALAEVLAAAPDDGTSYQLSLALRGLHEAAEWLRAAANTVAQRVPGGSTPGLELIWERLGELSRRTRGLLEDCGLDPRHGDAPMTTSAAALEFWSVVVERHGGPPTRAGWSCRCPRRGWPEPPGVRPAPSPTTCTKPGRRW